MHGENLHCRCPSHCAADTAIYGGKDGYFAYQTKLCVAAYYMGVITVGSVAFLLD